MLEFIGYLSTDQVPSVPERKLRVFYIKNLLLKNISVLNIMLLDVSVVGGWISSQSIYLSQIFYGDIILLEYLFSVATSNCVPCLYIKWWKLTLQKWSYPFLQVQYADVYMLDDGKRWKQLPSMPLPNSHIEFAWVVVNNSIIVVGGTTLKHPITKKMILLGEVFQFNLDTLVRILFSCLFLLQKYNLWSSNALSFTSDVGSIKDNRGNHLRWPEN